MKCKRLFALLLSLCMVASTIIAVPVSAATENVVEIVVNDASDITWLNGGTATDADGIGGRDGVIELSNLANSNNNTAGVKLPDGFAFQEGDTLTYSVDVYANGTKPDIWIRNHDSSLSPYTTFFNTVEANTWTTITKTITTEELDALIASGTGSGAFLGTSGNFALYLRPRDASTVYVDNFVVTIQRIAEEGGDEPEENRENVIDIKASLDAASELTWVASTAVTVTEVDGIGGRDNVLKAEGLSNSNNNSVGIALPDGFMFTEDDILTYSVDVYSETANNPDMWLRNHNGSVLNPVGTFYHEELSTGKWTTITKTLTYSDMVAAQTAMNSSGSWTEPGNYKLYIRPRSAGTLYLDNFNITVSRPIEVRGNVINITVEDASDITWKGGDAVTATDVDGIGGRDGVIELAGLGNDNTTTAGVVLAESFAFQEDDILTYTFDVYSDTVTNPDIWVRNHGTSLNPFITLYNSGITTGTWDTVTRTVPYSELAAAGAFDAADKYALYIRPRQSGTVYIDNFTVTVSRKDFVEPPADHEHSYGDWTEDDDTNHKKECSCGDVIKEAHTFDEGVVTTPPTTDTEGVKTFTCTVCGAIYTEPVDKLQPEEVRENVIDITINNASAITWKGGDAVTATDVDGIGGRDGVIELAGLGNGNTTTAGVVLAESFAFQENDILTYTFDVYSTVEHPDVWIRNHGSSLSPFTTFYHTVTTNTWTTITKTVTYEELIAAGAFNAADKYALYVRPRETGTVYVDNFTVTVSRPVEARADIINITVEDANDITWTNGGVAADANDIGGRDGVVELSNLANANGNTAGVALPDGFAFQAGDVLSYSFDVYSSDVTNPDLWLRNHGTSLNPFATLYHDNITANTWTTITKSYTFDELEAKIGTSNSSGTFATADNYALYFRPRQSGTVYIDNFTVTVSRKGIGKVIDIDAPLDASNELTWIATDAVTATDVDNIGGRNEVVKVVGLADSNNNTAGIKLPENFGFKAGDVIKFSVDLYSEDAINPDIWLRNHNGDVLTPYAVFYNTPMATNTWNTISQTITFEELTAKTAANSYDWTTVGNYAVYLRPRGGSTVYFDNFKFEVIREGYVGDPLTPPAPHEHTWGEGVVTQEPTTEAEGVRTYTCSGCGATKTEKIDKIVNPLILTVGNVTGKVGNEVTVPVTLEQNTGIGGAEIDIEYDAAALKLVRAEKGTALGGLNYQMGGDITANPIRFVWENENNDSSNGEIVLLTFKVLADVAGDYSVKVKEANLYAWGENNAVIGFEVTKVDGTITVITHTPGDVNEDDEFNALDIIATRRFITGGWGTVINTERADVDDDEKHTAKDVILLRRGLAGGYNVTLK